MIVILTNYDYDKFKMRLTYATAYTNTLIVNLNIFFLFCILFHEWSLIALNKN